jgi:hypothetical protein
MNPEPQRQVEIAKKPRFEKIWNPNFAKEPGQSFLWLNI